jgi:hypothetical protein
VGRRSSPLLAASGPVAPGSRRHPHHSRWRICFRWSPSCRFFTDMGAPSMSRRRGSRRRLVLGDVDLPLRGGADIPNGGGGTTGQRWRSPLRGYMQWAHGVPGLHSGGRDDTASTWLGRVSRCGVLRRSAGRGHGVLVESPPPPPLWEGDAAAVDGSSWRSSSWSLHRSGSAGCL